MVIWHEKAEACVGLSEESNDRGQSHTRPQVFGARAIFPIPSIPLPPHEPAAASNCSPPVAGFGDS